MILYLLIFIIGSIIGSFLNVCIYRIPRNESILFPASRCTSCRKPIPWYDNIPLFSYILLRGKCRFCKSRISFRYSAVELISASSLLFLFITFGLSSRSWIYSLLTFCLIVAAFIDLEFQIIPDRISLGGVFLGVILSLFVPGLHYSNTWKSALARSLSGAIIGGGIIYLTGIIGNLALKKESMGGGDVKLMAMLGSFLGWKMVLLIFFLAPFFGAPAGLYLKFIKKIDTIPYGPYLSIAGFVVMIWGRRILSFLFL